MNGYLLSDLCMKHPITKNRRPSATSAATKNTLANEDYWKVTVEDLFEIENQIRERLWVTI